MGGTGKDRQKTAFWLEWLHRRWSGSMSISEVGVWHRHDSPYACAKVFVLTCF